MAQCPAIVNSSVPDEIVTIDTINDVRLSTRNRTVGTTVSLTCHTGRTLVGESSLTCINNGGTAQWDKTIPSCAVNTNSQGNSSSALSEDELIVIGVVAAICILVIIMVIVMLCACWYRRRRDRESNKRPVSEYSANMNDFDRYQPYQMYSPFPLGRDGGSIDRRSRHYNSSLPRSSLPGSFPRTSHPNAYELQTRSAGVRPKPYSTYIGPRIARASSDTYEDYIAERNSPNYRPYVVGSDSRGSYDNEGFRGEWTDRYERKKFNDFNRDAYSQGRDPFLWDTRSPSSGF